MRVCEWCSGPIPAMKDSRARYCSDNCRRRASDERNRRACADCGRPLSPHGHARAGRPVLRCAACERGRRAAGHERALQLAATMYNEGAPQRDIAVALGWRESSNPAPLLGEARRRGLIGYRHRGYGV